MPGWLDYTGVVSSVTGAVLALATLLVARTARKAAQEARAAVQAQALGDAVQDMARLAELLAHAAATRNWGAYISVGVLLRGRLMGLMGRRGPLPDDARSELRCAARMLENGLMRVGEPGVEDEAEMDEDAMLGTASSVAGALWHIGASLGSTSRSATPGE